MEPITSPEVRPAWLPEAVWPYPLGAMTAGTRRVVYTDTGGPGPVLLFVHVGLWSLMWKDTIGNLSGRYRCVTLDVPGSGLSDRTTRAEQTLDVAAEAIGVLIDRLDLSDITLVIHDLGGLAALAAARTRLDRVASVAAVNTFAWKPRGVMLPVALRFMGSAIIREIAAFTGFLPWGSSTALGVGRRWDRATRRAWRAGLRDRASRRLPHRLFRDAARNPRIQQAAEAAVAALSDRPLVTVFGQLGDYFFFQRQWRRRHPALRAVTVPRGLHFPMCDNPGLVAAELARRLQLPCNATSAPAYGTAGDGRFPSRGGDRDGEHRSAVRRLERAVLQLHAETVTAAEPHPGADRPQRRDHGCPRRAHGDGPRRRP